mgnify:CR=1 FL=1
MGNSEVGHMNIGAGRVVWMDLPRINNAIADGSFAENKALAEFVARLKVSGGRAHIAGLVSNGGVHSHSDHVLAAARAMTAAGVQVQIHVFTDGRDVPPSSAKAQLFEFEQELPEGATIVSVCGRFYAMDRDNRWDRVKAAYQAIAFGAGRTAHSLNAALDAPWACKGPRAVPAPASPIHSMNFLLVMDTFFPLYFCFFSSNKFSNYWSVNLFSL